MDKIFATGRQATTINQSLILNKFNIIAVTNRSYLQKFTIAEITWTIELGVRNVYSIFYSLFL